MLTKIISVDYPLLPPQILILTEITIHKELEYREKNTTWGIFLQVHVNTSGRQIYKCGMIVNED